MTDVRYILKISKGSLVVIKADLQKSNGLYYVRGTTIIAFATPMTPNNHLPNSHDKSAPKDLTNSKINRKHGSSVNTETASNFSPVSKTDAVKIWHCQLVYMSELGFSELNKRCLLDGFNKGKLGFCEHYIFGKSKRVKFNNGTHTTKDTLCYINSDFWGPSHHKSLGVSSYMLTIIDDYSRKV